jgi:orotidine-5'-phosphate decarboxylase
LKQDDQRRVVTPSAAVQNGADYLVIGRPIRDAGDPVCAVQRIAAEIAEAL